ncbi:MAG: hypothetical protein GX591_04360 [Planctomycetes bacterium]|nr:hypothetical protein [Planctomycetota bacterium]
MRYAVSLAVVGVYCVAAAGMNIGSDTFTCPLDGTRFTSSIVASWSGLGISDDEGRAAGIGDTTEFGLHICPRCGYAGFAGDFPHEDDQGRPIQPLTPEEAEAVRAALAGQGPPAVRPEAMFPLEKAAAAEVCYRARHRPPDAMAPLHILGAWLSDGAGEDALAETYRRKAVEALQASAAAAEGSARCGRLCQAAAMLATLGQFDQAEALLASLAPEVDKGLRDEWAELTRTDPQPLLDDEASARLDAWDGLKSRVAWLKMKLQHRRLTEARSRHRALTGTLEDKQAYIELHAATASPESRAAIAEMFHNPLGPEETERVRCGVWTQEFAIGHSRGRLDASLWAAGLIPWDFHGDPPPSTARLIEDLQAIQQGRSDLASYDHMVAVARQLAERDEPEAATALWTFFQADPAWFASHVRGAFEDCDGVPPANAAIYRVLAARPHQACELAERMLLGAGAGKAAAVRLYPLAYIADAESLAVLKHALASDDLHVRIGAAKVLLFRGDDAGVATIVQEAWRNSTLVSLQHVLSGRIVQLAGPQHYEALVRLRDQWKTPPPDNDHPRGAIPPVWILPAMAQADPGRGLAVYRRWIAEQAAAPAETGDPASEGIPDYQRVADLRDAARLKYQPEIGRALARGLPMGDAGAIRTLAEAGEQAYVKEFAALLGRPTSLDVKVALIGASSKLDIPGAREALLHWSASRNRLLAAAAREALSATPAP